MSQENPFAGMTQVISARGGNTTSGIGASLSIKETVGPNQRIMKNFRISFSGKFMKKYLPDVTPEDELHANIFIGDKHVGVQVTEKGTQNLLSSSSGDPLARYLSMRTADFGDIPYTKDQPATAFKDVQVLAPGSFLFTI